MCKFSSANVVHTICVQLSQDIIIVITRQMQSIEGVSVRK